MTDWPRGGVSDVRRPTRRRSNDMSSHWRRYVGYWPVVVGAALVVAAILLVLSISSTKQEVAVVSADKDIAVAQRDATASRALSLAEQVARACSDPDAGEQLPAGTCSQANAIRSDPVPGVAGAPGAPGKEGPAGVAGTPGAAGTTGSTGPQGEVGPVGAPGPVGPQGDPGTNGNTGSTGSDGLAGPVGPPGAPGLPGINGRDGSPAQSYTLTFPDSTQTCIRDSGSPDTAPTYTCSAPVTTPPPTTEGGNGLLGG